MVCDGESNVILMFMPVLDFYLQVKLSIWEKKRGEEHRRILMEEAQRKQEGGVWSEIRKKRNKLVETWATR